MKDPFPKNRKNYRIYVARGANASSGVDLAYSVRREAISGSLKGLKTGFRIVRTK
jgi:hypothetical protein